MARKKRTKSTSRKRKNPRTHPGINKVTGRLKKGWRYNAKGQVVRAAK